jgi:hydrogenase expression/formation protein HypC
MCLAIPSKVIEIKEGFATIDTDGVRRAVSLVLLDDIKIGDYVIVHAGYAIQRIDEESATKSLETFREALAIYEEQP